MLDNETKRKIDTARDILVGKVPDPKSQVEQITIALIYKFMDDMDLDSLSMGGERSFFTGQYEKYAWTNLLDPSLGGFDALNLYMEAIDKMRENLFIPQLFRSIFKNAYLPYRDPETLKMFLKTINDFHYDHSEDLGDAFEYLLSVLGSQGDAGQFRTPRHIIDFIVAVVDPKKEDKILDPACGTAGFLISSYKHILGHNKHKAPGDLLNQDEKNQLLKNFAGYDISPDMVRLSLVNLYLHGFVNPQVYEYDTLSSVERWNEYADVILANPPFMSPKGGIKPHKKFTVESTRSEVLFVDYIKNHLHKNGRAGIIVPEGIIFQSGTSYKKLRKNLVEDGLYAVVSLPSGVFQPYSGVKTSILFFDNDLTKQTDNILFVKVESDGFDLGAQRRPTSKNDLPQTLEIIKDFQSSVENTRGHLSSDNCPQQTIKSNLPAEISSPLSLLVPKSRIAENGDYNLSGDRYRVTTDYSHAKWPMVKLGEVCEKITDGSHNPPKEDENGTDIMLSSQNIIDGKITLINARKINSSDFEKENLRTNIKKGDVLLTIVGTIGRVAVVPENNNRFTVQRSVAVLKVNPTRLLSNYFASILSSNQVQVDLNSKSAGVAQKGIYLNSLNSIEIPLPPLEIQQQIVAELDGYQNIITGAKQIVANWKPTIDIDPTWDKVKLGDICDLSQGFAVNAKTSHALKDNGDFPLLRIKDLINNNFELKVDSKLVPKNTIIAEDDLLYSRTGQIGLVFTGRVGVLHNNLFKINFNNKRVIKKYLMILLSSEDFRKQVQSLSNRSAQPDVTHTVFKNIQIQIPPLEIQEQIVEGIESEQVLVESAKKLITLYTQKISTTLAKLWEE